MGGLYQPLPTAVGKARAVLCLQQSTTSPLILRMPEIRQQSPWTSPETNGVMSLRLMFASPNSSQSVISQVAAAAAAAPASKKSLEMQTFTFNLKLTEAETRGFGPPTCVLISIPGDFFQVILMHYFVAGYAAVLADVIPTLFSSNIKTFLQSRG